MQAIQPFLWFNDNAEEAARFYVSVFPNARIGTILRAPEGGPTPAGSVLTITFFIDNQQFVALNGGPHAKFTDALSLVAPCDSQAEIDAVWEKLTAGGGEEVACGWLRDKFGVSWQVVPANIGELIQGKTPEGGKRAMQALMGMKKLNVEALRRAGGLA